MTRPATLLGSHDARIVLVALVGLASHAVLRYGRVAAVPAAAPLVAVLIAGGLPLIVALAGRALSGQFGADHLAGISIAASVLLEEYLAGTIVADALRRQCAGGIRRLRGDVGAAGVGPAQLTLCRTMILDKTGTLTYGRPALSDEDIHRAVYSRPIAAGRCRD